MGFINSIKKNVLIYFFIFSPITAVFSSELQYGLKFHAYSYEPEMRTGLDLYPDNFFSFSNGFSICFDVKFDFSEIQTYGYVFRIVDKKGNKIDFVLGDKVITFSSSIGNIVFSKPFRDISLLPDKWLKVELNVNINAGKLELKIGDVAQDWKIPEVKDVKHVRIVFGKNSYPTTSTVDVPNMTIRDIRIQNGNEELYHWKLSKYVSTGVYDELKKHFAKCENPDWVLTQNTKWKKESTFTCSKNPYIAYDSDKNIVAVADEHTFYSFLVNDKLLEKQDVVEKLPFSRYANQMIYNPLDSNYYVYNLLGVRDGREMVVFNQQTGIWGQATHHNHYSDYWHHNRYFSTEKNKLFLLGGYGHHRYKKDVITYNVADDAWSNYTLAGDSIEPSYLSGLGVISDRRLLRFGGYGSKSGIQELSPQHYYSAYMIDIETMKSTKIWTLKSPEENFVVSNSLIVDTTNNCFYALSYPFTKFNTTVVLRKFSLTEPKYEILADTIHLGFKDTESFVDLFLDKINQKLIAVTSSSISTDSLTSISIYSLSYPPLEKADLFQSEKVRNSLSLIVLISVFIFFSIFILFRKIKKMRKTGESDLQNKDTEGESEDSGSSSGITTIKSIRKQSICLFGGFYVIDKDGNDLTLEFKPLVISLFLIVLLNTIKNGKGISFSRLKEILWFDMTEENANNNRGVAMSKIRQIMKHVGKVNFLKQGIYWKIEFENDVYCDYYEALILMNKIKESKEIDIKDVTSLLSIVSEGELLPSIQTEWIDSFKSDFSNEFIDLILPLIRSKNTEFSDSFLIDMTNAIFIFDPLNEDALRYKCSILIKMGKHGLAKKAYLTFTREYEAWFATKFEYSFDQIVS